MTDPKLEQQARELLAAEWRKSGRIHAADRLISAGYRHWLRDADIDAISAIVAALSQQRAVPEGWVLVPKQATPAMVGAWTMTPGTFDDAYAAMLNAAPSPKKEK